jgi:phospholipid/cholesterol/gamma-HCH transport system substrate-binding protein
VIAICVPDSPSARFRVRWRINANLRGLVRADSVVTIETEGVVGGTYLSVQPGSPHALQSPALATIRSKEPVEVSDLLTRGASLMNYVQAMLKVGPKLGGALDSDNTTVSNVNNIAVGPKQGRGPAGMLLRDETLANQIRQTIAVSSSNVQEILAGVKAGRGPAGMLLRDESVREPDAGDGRSWPRIPSSLRPGLGPGSATNAAKVRRDRG